MRKGPLALILMLGEPISAEIPVAALTLTTYAPASLGKGTTIIPVAALLLTTYAPPGSITVWDHQSVRAPDAVVWDLAPFDQPPT